MSLEEGRAARDKGMAKVMRQGWTRRYRRLFNTLFPIGTCGISETFHVVMRACGLEEPHAPQAWGANWGQLARAGWIVPTGETGQMKRTKAHGRAHCPVYRKAANAKVEIV
jgi:hypothetical protein